MVCGASEVVDELLVDDSLLVLVGVVEVVESGVLVVEVELGVVDVAGSDVVDGVEEVEASELVLGGVEVVEEDVSLVEVGVAEVSAGVALVSAAVLAAVAAVAAVSAAVAAFVTAPLATFDPSPALLLASVDISTTGVSFLFYIGGVELLFGSAYVVRDADR